MIEAGMPHSMRAQEYQVLLVTENEDGSESLERILAEDRGHDFRLERAPDTEELMKRLGTSAIDAVLLAGSLGDTSMTQIAIRLLELNCDLPIVAVTDEDSEDQAAELLATGVQDVLWRSELDADRLGRALRYAIDRAATLRELLESESMLHSILKNLTEGVIVADRQEKLLLVNPAARELLGLGSVSSLATDIFGMYEADTVTRIPDTARPMARALRGESVSEQEIFHRNADAPAGRFLSVNSRPLKDANGQIKGGIVSFRDVTARRKVEQELTHLALHDGQTNIPNRAFFVETLHKAIARADRSHSRLAVLLLNLDGLKQINDRFSYETGDLLLKDVARRLADGLRAGDFLARIGGDEFVVMFEDLGHDEHAASLADKIREVLGPAFAVGEHQIPVTASIGISTFPECGDDAGSLIKTAEVAMRRAKESGRDTYHFYSRSVHAEMSRRAELERDLREAVEQEHFELEFQPIADLGNGRIEALEVLLRWNHPEHGLVRPMEFVPILEATGMMNGVGEWVLASACLQVRDWQRVLSRPELSVTVNLSAAQLGHRRIVDVIERILTNADLDPANLILEVNEATLLTEPRAVRENLSVLARTGVRLALDDFGTGMMALQTIRHLPLSLIKIDRSLVMSLPADPEDIALVDATLRLAEDLDLKVVAEGLEVNEQLRFLAERGCDLGQGNLVSPPLPVTSIHDFLGRDWRAA
jgi:diguanylate cyclase (GGDEF)-like protein/PAS domain S-box-containing protein